VDFATEYFTGISIRGHCCRWMWVIVQHYFMWAIKVQMVVMSVHAYSSQLCWNS